MEKLSGDFGHRRYPTADGNSYAGEDEEAATHNAENYRSSIRRSQRKGGSGNSSSQSSSELRRLADMLVAAHAMRQQAEARLAAQEEAEREFDALCLALERRGEAERSEAAAGGYERRDRRGHHHNEYSSLPHQHQHRHLDGGRYDQAYDSSTRRDDHNHGDGLASHVGGLNQSFGDDRAGIHHGEGYGQHAYGPHGHHHDDPSDNGTHGILRPLRSEEMGRQPSGSVVRWGALPHDQHRHQHGAHRGGDYYPNSHDHDHSHSQNMITRSGNNYNVAAPHPLSSLMYGHTGWENTAELKDQYDSGYSSAFPASTTAATTTAANNNSAAEDASAPSHSHSLHHRSLAAGRFANEHNTRSNRGAAAEASAHDNNNGPFDHFGAVDSATMRYYHERPHTSTAAANGEAMGMGMGINLSARRHRQHPADHQQRGGAQILQQHQQHHQRRISLVGGGQEESVDDPNATLMRQSGAADDQPLLQAVPSSSLIGVGDGGMSPHTPYIIPTPSFGSIGLSGAAAPRQQSLSHHRNNGSQVELGGSEAQNDNDDNNDYRDDAASDTKNDDGFGQHYRSAARPAHSHTPTSHTLRSGATNSIAAVEASASSVNPHRLSSEQKSSGVVGANVGTQSQVEASSAAAAVVAERFAHLLPPTHPFHAPLLGQTPLHLSSGGGGNTNTPLDTTSSATHADRLAAFYVATSPTASLSAARAQRRRWAENAIVADRAAVAETTTTVDDETGSGNNDDVAALADTASYTAAATTTTTTTNAHEPGRQDRSTRRGKEAVDHHAEDDGDHHQISNNDNANGEAVEFVFEESPRTVECRQFIESVAEALSEALSVRMRRHSSALDRALSSATAAAKLETAEELAGRGAKDYTNYFCDGKEQVPAMSAKKNEGAALLLGEASPTRINFGGAARHFPTTIAATINGAENSTNYNSGNRRASAVSHTTAAVAAAASSLSVMNCSAAEAICAAVPMSLQEMCDLLGRVGTVMVTMIQHWVGVGGRGGRQKDAKSGGPSSKRVAPAPSWLEAGYRLFLDTLRLDAAAASAPSPAPPLSAVRCCCQVASAPLLLRLGATLCMHDAATGNILEAITPIPFSAQYVEATQQRPKRCVRGGCAYSVSQQVKTTASPSSASSSAEAQAIDVKMDIFLVKLRLAALQQLQAVSGALLQYVSSAVRERGGIMRNADGAGGDDTDNSKKDKNGDGDLELEGIVAEPSSSLFFSVSPISILTALEGIAPMLIAVTTLFSTPPRAVSVEEANAPRRCRSLLGEWLLTSEEANNNNNNSGGNVGGGEESHEQMDQCVCACRDRRRKGNDEKKDSDDEADRRRLLVCDVLDALFARCGAAAVDAVHVVDLLMSALSAERRLGKKSQNRRKNKGGKDMSSPNDDDNEEEIIDGEHSPIRNVPVAPWTDGSFVRVRVVRGDETSSNAAAVADAFVELSDLISSALCISGGGGVGVDAALPSPSLLAPLIASAPARYQNLLPVPISAVPSDAHENSSQWAASLRLLLAPNSPPPEEQLYF